MFTTPAQVLSALSSNHVRMLGIDDICICYAGESAIITKDKNVSCSDGWKGLNNYHTKVERVFIDGDRPCSLYIYLGDSDDELLFDGKLNNLTSVLTSQVRLEWNIGVNSGKWLYDNGAPIINGMDIVAPNYLYVY